MDPTLKLNDVEAPPPSVPPYEIIRQIRRGKTADIFLARAPSEEGKPRNVVLRRLRRELAGDRDLCATFFHQGRLAVRLRHRNLIETYAVRRDNDESYVITEFLDGHPLSILRDKPNAVIALPLLLYVRILTNVLDGLQYLHDSREIEAPDGIVHGDVRPENVFVTSQGETKVLHAGIEIEGPASVAREKLAYMAPERARGESMDRRSDVFSVGLMLWEAVTGLRFWQDWSDSAILRRLGSQSLPVQRSWIPTAERGLFEVAERALRVDPAARFATATEMRAAIDEALFRAGDVVPPNALKIYMQTALALERKRAGHTDDDDPTRVFHPGEDEPTRVLTTIEDEPTRPRHTGEDEPTRPVHADQDELTRVRQVDEDERADDEPTRVRRLDDELVAVRQADKEPVAARQAEPVAVVKAADEPVAVVKVDDEPLAVRKPADEDEPARGEEVSAAPSLVGLALHLSRAGIEGRQRTYALAGVAAIFCGAWILGKAVARRTADEPRDSKVSAAACASEIPAPMPAPPAAVPVSLVTAAASASATPAATSPTVRPAPRWQPRTKRPPREDPWGI